jgi:hypothetical protein
MVGFLTVSLDTEGHTGLTKNSRNCATCPNFSAQVSDLMAASGPVLPHAAMHFAGMHPRSRSSSIWQPACQSSAQEAGKQNR